MKEENAIEVKNITKYFKIYYDKGNSLKEKVLFQKRNRHDIHWVLKGISFDVKKGEALGLIGKNGCGKSTLLKMLTKIMYPTEGSIQRKGRISSLIELGAGFHPDMTGRENIFTNASIFGLNHEEIKRRMDDIIKFSELEEFIDNPVRTYSSGMYMRLAFAVAINVDADILLIDEILAVGDVSFQAKCFEKLKEIKVAGTTIVIVSHVMEQIEQICDRAIWIEDGLIREEGEPRKIGKDYLSAMEEKRAAKIEDDFQNELKEQKETAKKHKNKKMAENLPAFCRKDASRNGNGQIRFEDGGIFHLDGKQTMFFSVKEPIEFRMKYQSDIDMLGQEVNISINITRDDGIHCFGTSALSGMDGKYSICAKEHGEAILKIECNNLLPGRYLVDLGIQGFNNEVYDYLSNALEFRVSSEQDKELGIVHLPHCWKVDGQIFDE